ncbi:uncharacterized protein METZ01_LOCUS338178 [marine metagenome]|jgi:hypothetical protein|uniref:Cytochrome c domain-containing protein n=1 Tax=marine metagenome TaxID=408172 RepID=A0A382QIG6_9ZZZZ|tara:strand:- start:58 stop:453 length:396 start_codon:yes stop_codon:yes gene_type:complete
MIMKKFLIIINLIIFCNYSVTNAQEIAFNLGENFFYTQVIPKLAENGCIACHGVGYLRPKVTDYKDLLKRLAIGDSEINNALIYKIANVRSINPEIPNHPGGQRCKTVDSEPCKTIQKWWQIEFGDQRDVK